MDTRLLCLLLLSLSGCVTSSNVDTTESIAFRGDERSYFGYSVNLYRYRNNPSMRYVLIGAPRANSSSAVFQTGNTFRCDVLDPGSCTPLALPDLDTPDATVSSESYNGPIEDKANMWMGGTVTSSYDSGVVVTSGHRYFRVGDEAHDPVGLTYVLQSPSATGVKLSPCADANCDTRISRFGHCMSGFSSLILSDGSQLYIGATGYNFFTGSLFRGFESSNCQEGIFREETGFFGYMAYSLTSGRILDSDIETVVASGPRQNSHLGNVYLFNNNTDFELTPVLSLHGTTQDSFYGFSILAVDLNRDGMDELLVSAPMYSLPGSPEIGQVLVYPNVGSGLGTARTYIQQIPYARFGTALADLGDLDKDGYPEIAISAPYGQQAGSVFIYSGTSQGSLTTQPIQTIRGEDVGLGIGAAFGASVSGKQDIDDNGYNDILVGAYVDGSAFLLRTLPIVSVTVTPSNTPMFPIIDLAEARDAGFTTNLTIGSSPEQEFIYFMLNWDISYTPLGDTPSSIRINLTITSDPERQSSRVFFLDSNTPIRTYQTDFQLFQDTVETMSMPVYILNLGTEAYTFDFSYSVINPSVIDFNTSVVLANPTSVPRFSVQPELDCGTDALCIPDLNITATVVFPTRTTDPTERYTEIIAGEVNEFSIDITVTNRGENSFGTRMSLTIPPGTSFRIATIDNADLVIGCQNPQSSNGFITLTCSPLGRPLGNSQLIKFSVVLGTETVSGDEGVLLVQMNLLSNNPDANNTIADNSVNVSVPVTAVADISVSVEVRPDRLAFNETTELRIQDLIDDVNNEFFTLSNLGSEIIHTFTVRNAGPSPILNSRIEIDWPIGLRNADSPDDLSLRDYFLYITSIDSNIVLCDSTYVNIRNLRTSTTIIDEGNSPSSGEGRRRRGTLSTEDMKPQKQVRKMNRRKRQTTVEVDPEFNSDVDQASYPEAYVKIVCAIGTFPGSTEYELQMTTRVFEPTLVDRAPLSTWTFNVGVTARITDEHVNQPPEHQDDSSSITITLVPSSVFVAVEGFTLWWVIVVAIGLFVALLFPVFLILYFAGFFKKDKAKRAKDDEEKKRLQLWHDNQKKGGDKPF